MMFSPFGGGGAFSAMFFLVFGIIVVVFIVTAVRGASRWSKNNASPRIPAHARVVSKREDVSSHYHSSDGTGNVGGYRTSSTWYYVTFEFGSGDRMEFAVDGREFGLLAEGDEGTLTFQGMRFLKFERNL